MDLYEDVLLQTIFTYTIVVGQWAIDSARVTMSLNRALLWHQGRAPPDPNSTALNDPMNPCRETQMATDHAFWEEWSCHKEVISDNDLQFVVVGDQVGDGWLAGEGEQWVNEMTHLFSVHFSMF